MLQRLLQNYTAGDELEIRYYLDPRTKSPQGCNAQKYPNGFQSVVETIIKSCGDCIPIKFIDLQLDDVRKRIEFTSDRRTETWTRKVKKCDTYVEPNDFGGFRVALATETTIAACKLDKVDRIAAKFRQTFALNCDWKLDISAVKVCTLSTVQQAKIKLLACEDPIALWGWWDHWEFEIEYVGSVDPVLTCSGIYEWYAKLAPLVNFDMLDMVRKVSVMLEHPRQESFQKISPRNTIARLLPKAIEPTLDTFLDEFGFRVAGMILRDKIDGTRELIVVQDGQLICVSARSIDRWDESITQDTYVFDTEFYDDTWYILHCLIWCGRNVTALPDSERMALLVDLPAIDGLAICPWMKIVNPALDIVSWNERSVPQERDGLLLATDVGYWQQECIKWKPAERSTQDMLIVKCPSWLDGKAPFVKQADGDTLYLLNVGVNANIVVKQHGFPLKRYLDIFHLDPRASYVPQPFAPLDNPTVYIWSTAESDLDGHIGEFLYDKRWILKRKRDDKPSLMRGGTEIGNDIKTALDIWSKQSCPFPMEYLYKTPAEQDNKFSGMRVAVETVISELTDEEQVATAISHMLPFMPFNPKITPHRAVLVPATPHTDYHPARITVTHIPYVQLGKIVLPKEFIGGAQLVVTMDPELLGHVSCISKTVASGGRLVIVCRLRGDPDADSHPLVGLQSLMKDLERAGFTLITDHGSPEGDAWDVEESRFAMFNILSFRKENRGTSEMASEEVIKENPHLRANPTANFSFKFARQKTKELGAINEVKEPCLTLEVNPLKGELLVDIEFLSTLPAATQILYFGTQLTRLIGLFPLLNFSPSQENVETLIVHSLPYQESADLIARYSPHSGVVDFNHEDLLTNRVIKGKCMLHPYAELGSTKVSVVFGRNRETWNILSDIFEKEMQTFHKIYRASAFKYVNRIVGLDNCYDCRTLTFIISKYSKSQKITVDEAYKRFTTC